MKLLSRVQLCATPWTAAYQAPPSMGFSRQEYWSGVPLPSPYHRRYSLINEMIDDFHILLIIRKKSSKSCDLDHRESIWYFLACCGVSQHFRPGFSEACGPPEKQDPERGNRSRGPTDAPPVSLRELEPRGRSLRGLCPHPKPAAPGNFH